MQTSIDIIRHLKNIISFKTVVLNLWLVSKVIDTLYNLLIFTIFRGIHSFSSDVNWNYYYCWIFIFIIEIIIEIIIESENYNKIVFKHGESNRLCLIQG